MLGLPISTGISTTASVEVTVNFASALTGTYVTLADLSLTALTSFKPPEVDVKVTLNPSGKLPV